MQGEFCVSTVMHCLGYCSACFHLMLGSMRLSGIIISLLHFFGGCFYGWASMFNISSGRNCLHFKLSWPTVTKRKTLRILPLTSQQPGCRACHYIIPNWPSKNWRAHCVVNGLLFHRHSSGLFRPETLIGRQLAINLAQLWGTLCLHCLFLQH